MVLQLASSLKIVVAGFLDDNPRATDPFFHTPHLGALAPLAAQLPGEANAWFPAIGDNLLRDRIASAAEARWGAALSLVHPTAQIGPLVRIAQGVFIGPGAILNFGASVGAYAIVNTGAVVEHDCQIAPGCHIAPNATLCGGVTLGEGVFVGAGAVVIPNKTIGAGAVVGAGAIVHQDVPAGQIWVGNPAKRLR
jgi:UDP-perosamine 4-acetyltransferase